MKIWLSWLLILGGILPTLGQAEDPFFDGERLEYSASWTGVPAGEISLSSSKKADDRWVFTMVAKTNYFWSMVYKVRDRVTSTVSLTPFRSHYYYKNAKQGSRHIEEKVEMDYKKREVRRSKQKLSANEAAGLSTISLEKQQDVVLDPLSMIYGIRKFSFLDPKELDKSEFHVFASKGIYDLKFQLIDEMEYDSNLFGKRKVWHLKPSAEYEGSLVSKGTLELWIDCLTGVPLKILFNIPVGWATLELTSSNRSDLKKESYRNRRKRR
jgi:hypothetical protein